MALMIFAKNAIKLCWWGVRIVLEMWVDIMMTILGLECFIIQEVII